MELLYTAEARDQIERVMRVFQDYIVESRHFDILYSEKIGYIYLDIDPKRKEVAERFCIPSLSERQQVVSTLLPKASFDGMTVRFNEEQSTLTEMPYFNYLILDDDPVFTDFPDGSSRMTENSWSIFCFSSFDEMSEYIQQQELMCFIVYVRDNGRYRKAQHRFAVQRPGCEKIYVNEWGFHYPDADLADTYDRNPAYRYYFEIVGLCEIHCEDEISTCIISSLDDLGDELGGRASDKAMQWVRELVRVTGSPYHEKGTVHYEGSLYTYCIEIEKDSIMWNFSNERQEPYCPSLHAFCTPVARCCERDMPYQYYL